MKAISILIVDETSVFLELLAQLFSDMEPRGNAAVETLSDFEKSVPRAQAVLPDVIVHDLGLPGLRGLPSIRRLRMAMPNARIIALSAMDSPAYRSEAIRAGADEVIYKGNAFWDLVPAIDRILQARS